MVNRAILEQAPKRLTQVAGAGSASLVWVSHDVKRGCPQKIAPFILFLGKVSSDNFERHSSVINDFSPLSDCKCSFMEGLLMKANKRVHYETRSARRSLVERLKCCLL